MLGDIDHVLVAGLVEGGDHLVGETAIFRVSHAAPPFGPLALARPRLGLSSAGRVHGHWARWRSIWSARTTAIIASPTGTARMPTQGSWRPCVSISTSLPSESTVRIGFDIELVGLTAKRTTMSCPVEMPPRMPPARFDRK